jgi:hypothetical protein
MLIEAVGMAMIAFVACFALLRSGDIGAVCRCSAYSRWARSGCFR